MVLWIYGKQVSYCTPYLPHKSTRLPTPPLSTVIYATLKADRNFYTNTNIVVNFNFNCSITQAPLPPFIEFTFSIKLITSMLAPRFAI